MVGGPTLGNPGAKVFSLSPSDAPVGAGRAPCNSCNSYVQYNNLCPARSPNPQAGTFTSRQANLKQRALLARRPEHRRWHRPARHQPMQLGNRILRQFPQLSRELHFPPPLARRVEYRPALHRHAEHFLQAKPLRAKLRIIIPKRPPLPLLILDRCQAGVGANVRRLLTLVSAFCVLSLSCFAFPRLNDVNISPTAPADPTTPATPAAPSPPWPPRTPANPRARAQYPRAPCACWPRATPLPPSTPPAAGSRASR